MMDRSHSIPLFHFPSPFAPGRRPESRQCSWMRAHAVERLPTKSLAHGVTMFQTRINCIRHDHPCIGSVNLAQRHLAGKAKRGLAVRLNPMLGPASGSRCSTLVVSRDYLRPSGFAVHINDNDNDTERSKRWERPGGFEPGTWGPATEPVSSTSPLPQAELRSRHCCWQQCCPLLLSSLGFSSKTY